MARKRKAFYTAKEMRELMDVNDFQNYVHMPNEIYSDFTTAFAELKEETDVNARSSHVAYAFGYTFLAHYMWRYARYYTWDNATGAVPINEAIVKQMLGFGAKSEAYTYLTKNNVGFLEQLGYIKKVTDKPISHYKCEQDIEYLFTMESQSGSPDKVNHKGWKVAMPVKAIWRKPEDMKTSKFETGTIHNIDNTHMVDMDTFIFCITHPELGVEGFYLHSFLKFMTDRFDNAFDCSNTRMASMTGLSLDEVKSQLKNLERYNMITNDHKPFCLDKPKDKKALANTYGIIESDRFAQNLMQMNTIPDQKKISKERYEKEYGWAYEHEVDGKIVDKNTGEIVREVKKAKPFSLADIDDSDMDDLPF